MQTENRDEQYIEAKPCGCMFFYCVDALTSIVFCTYHGWIAAHDDALSIGQDV